jgi:hypothetical protein
VKNYSDKPKGKQSPGGVTKDWSPRGLQGVRIRDESGAFELKSDGGPRHHGVNNSNKTSSK